MTAQMTSHTRPTVTLTRRGRLVILMLALAAVCGVFAMGRQSARASDGHVPPAAVSQTTVEAGESLWAVSSRLWPSSDPRDGVSALLRANHLSEDAPLAVGAVLRVP